MTPEPTQAAPPYRFKKTIAYAAEVSSYRVLVDQDGKTLDLGRVTQEPYRHSKGSTYWVAWRASVTPDYLRHEGDVRRGKPRLFRSRKEAADALILRWQQDKEEAAS